MNVWSLLTKGRTIKGGKDRTGTYKLPKGSALPNFSKPSASPTLSHQASEQKILQPVLFDQPVQPGKAEVPVRATPDIPAHQGTPTINQTATLTGAVLRVAAQTAAQKSLPVRSTLSQEGLKPRQTGRSFWQCFVDVIREIKNRWSRKHKRSPFQARTVQTELALDKISVMRNDLSEEDLEVVPVAKKVPQQRSQHDQCQTISTNQ